MQQQGINELTNLDESFAIAPQYLDESGARIAKLLPATISLLGHTIAPLNHAIDLIELTPDLESTEPPAVTDLRQQLGGSDGLLISSPEYAHGIPGVLKNALDWSAKILMQRELLLTQKFQSRCKLRLLRLQLRLSTSALLLILRIESGLCKTYCHNFTAKHSPRPFLPYPRKTNSYYSNIP